MMRGVVVVLEYPKYVPDIVLKHLELENHAPTAPYTTEIFEAVVV